MLVSRLKSSSAKVSVLDSDAEGTISPRNDISDSESAIGLWDLPASLLVLENRPRKRETAEGGGAPSSVGLSSNMESEARASTGFAAVLEAAVEADDGKSIEDWGDIKSSATAASGADAFMLGMGDPAEATDPIDTRGSESVAVGTTTEGTLEVDAPGVVASFLLKKESNPLAGFLASVGVATVDFEGWSSRVLRIPQPSSAVGLTNRFTDSSHDVEPREV